MKETDQTDNNSRQSKGSNAASRNSKDSRKRDQALPAAASESWIAYNNTLSGTFEKSTKESIPPVMSDTSSLTDPHKRHEKYATHIAAAEQQEPNEGGPPREIAASKPRTHSSKRSDKERARSLIHSWSHSKDAGSANRGILPATSSGSSEKHNRYHVESPVNGDGLSEINPSKSAFTSSNSRRRSSKTGEKPYDRYAEIKQRHSNSTEARTNRSSPKSATKKGHEGNMYTKSLMTEESSYMNETAPMGRAERTKRGQMKELDEYSVAISVQDDPALVQCLKFYHCAAAASIAGFASGWLPMGNTVTKEVKMLGRGPDLDEVDKMRYREESLGGLIASPDPVPPKVEVVKEEEDETGSDDATIDAPDLKAADPNTSSYLREVTSLSLRLDDGGLEEKRQQPALDRGRAMAAEAEVDLNISEIAIPHSSSLKIQKSLAKQKQREENDRMQQREAVAAVEAEKAADVGDHAMEPSNMKEAEKYAPEIEVIDKQNSGSTEESSRPASAKKGLSKIFSRFGKKSKSKSVGSSTAGSGTSSNE
eukprot:scaffold2595_cov158-Amphora_coffeaeformis.AAC.4